MGCRWPPKGGEGLAIGRLDMAVKRCSKCGEEKPDTEFDSRGPSGGTRGQCKCCRRIYMRNWMDKHRGKSTHYQRVHREKHPEEAKASRKKINSSAREKFIHKHGCTPHRYYAHGTSGVDLLAEQGGVCAICKTPIETMLARHVHIDHCHASNLVRGVLCRDCNLMLGFAKDSVATLRNAIDYLTTTGVFK
jgi:hypothetical protein